MKTLLLLMLTLFVTTLIGPAFAACQCVCVNGQMQPLCSSSLDIAMPCIGICPIAPPAIAPLPSLALPPLGTSYCQNEQVWNGVRYEWQRVCR